MTIVIIDSAFNPVCIIACTVYTSLLHYIPCTVVVPKWFSLDVTKAIVVEMSPQKNNSASLEVKESTHSDWLF